jgi:hypothetical protein
MSAYWLSRPAAYGGLGWRTSPPNKVVTIVLAIATARHVRDDVFMHLKFDPNTYYRRR